ncbi:hypothetical protein ACFSAG_07420 [Sphingorhabdus buctiana]|jgi:hypothetical protein|uniref:Uncharacterized protein n=1 Tax=Sphingorhabdus buctiana TaxID=1508805 RepID=A0ABW4MCS6_9SPHN
MKEYYSQHVKEYRRRMRLRGEIINKIEGHEYSNAENAAFELVNQLNPTHFVTLQLKQQRQIKANNGWSVWVRGDDAVYYQAYQSFVQALSKRTQPKSLWQSQKLTIGNAGILEGGFGRMRNHMHLVLTKPANLNEIYFRGTICMLAECGSWLMGGEFGVNIQRIRTAKDQINATFYSAKRGIDRIMIA